MANDQRVSSITFGGNVPDSQAPRIQFTSSNIIALVDGNGNATGTFTIPTISNTTLSVSGASTLGTVTATSGVIGPWTISALGSLLGQLLQTSNRGATMSFQVVEEDLPLSTSGTTTNTIGNLLPANSLILAVCGRVSTTIATATDWALGDSTTAARFAAANATLTAGTRTAGIVQWSGAVSTLATGPSQASATTVRVTTSGTPSAGAITLTVFAVVFGAATA